MNYIPSKIIVLGDPPLSREDELRLETWQKLRTAGFAHIDGSHETRIAVSLSALRQHQPRIFRQLCRSDTECAAIAVRHSWPAEREEYDWHGITESQIRTKLRALDGHPWRKSLGLMLAGAVQRHAPELLGLLPPEFLTVNNDRSAA